MKKLTSEQKKSLIKKVPSWWHTIDLGNGVVTPGFTPSLTHRLITLAIPKNLKNKTVLDIGAWDGYYSFECEKRGAQVTAIDNNQHKKGHKGFDTAKKILNSKVIFYETDLFDLQKKFKNKKFDVVLFFGVLYHLKYPLEGLEVVSSVVKKQLLLESHFIETKTKEPIMRFYPGKELSNDATNWWGPNIQCIIDMLKTVGFKKIQILGKHLNKKEKRGRVMIKAFK